MTDTPNPARPAGLDALLGYVAANLPATEQACAHDSWDVTNEHKTAAGWAKGRKCSDCREVLPTITEAEPHWDIQPAAPAEEQRAEPAADPDRPALDLLTEIYKELGHGHRARPLAAALLAAHTRELSARARRNADEYRDKRGVTRSTRGLLTGMDHTRKLLDAHADTLDKQPAEQPPAPVLRFPQLAVPCPRCGAPRGQLCTSHGGSRVRRNDTHVARTDAYQEQEAG
ncbi:hypothetical protein ACFRQM_32965 [Streptomyces sp. NPDC056831]|uniref:zinc finger domain-containing protein n=1 Tax=Streptomyces sp. NPDC056831 TaxID=3345954 RepID=UPI0036A37852